MDHPGGGDRRFGETPDRVASTATGLRQLATGWTLALIAGLFTQLAYFAIFKFYLESGHSFTSVPSIYLCISLGSLAVSVVVCWMVVSGLYRIADVSSGPRAAQIDSWARLSGACFIVLTATLALLRIAPRFLGGASSEMFMRAQPYTGLFCMALGTAGFFLVIYLCDALVEAEGGVVPSGARAGLMLVLVFRIALEIYSIVAKGSPDSGTVLGYGLGIVETLALYGLAIWLVRETARQVAAGRGPVSWQGDDGGISLPPQSGASDMLIGGMMFFVGLGVTVISYTQAAEGGGRYVVTTGAIIYGGVRFVRGLSQGMKNLSARKE